MSAAKQKEADAISKQIHEIREKVDHILYSNIKLKNTHFQSSWMHYCDEADPDVPYRLNNEMLEEAIKLFKGTDQEKHIDKIMEHLEAQNKLIKDHTNLIREVQKAKDMEHDLNKGNDAQQRAKDKTILGRKEVQEFKAIFQRDDL